MLTGFLAVAALVAAATRLRSRVLGAFAVVSAGATTVLVVAADAAPEQVAILAVPVLALAVEVAALATVGDRFWEPLTAASARIAELVGLLLVPVVGLVVVGGAGTVSSEAELVLPFAVLAVAWATAGARRLLGTGWRHDAAVAGVGSTALHVTAAVAAAGPASTARVWFLLATVAVSLAWVPSSIAPGSAAARSLSRRSAVPRPGTTSSPSAGDDGWAAAIVLASTGAALALAVVWSSGLVLLAGAVVVLVFAVHLRAAAHPAVGDVGAVAAALLLAAAITTTLLVVTATAAAAAVPTPTRSLAVVAVALGLARLSDRLPVHADLARVVAVVAAMWPTPATAGVAGATGGQQVVLSLFGAGPEALAPAVVASAWLAFDAVRVGRVRLLAAATPAAIRVVVSAGLAVGLGPEHVAVGLFGLASVALQAALSAGRWRLPAGVAAAAGGTAGWLLLGDAPELRAWAALVLAAVLVATGLLRRRPGLLAVVAGGARRLAGPLVVGTLLLTTVAVVETLALVASVPTWGWLALSGFVLLAAAVAIERSGATPVVTARRWVDVIDERFD
jgi:hypothetical protein